MKKLAIILLSVLVAGLFVACNQEVTIDAQTYANMEVGTFVLNGQNYATLQAAIDAAKAGKSSKALDVADNVIRMTKNVEGPGAVVSGLTGYSIDFGEYTYTFTNIASGSAGLSISDGSEMSIKGAMKMADTSNSGAALVSVDDSNVEIKDAVLTTGDNQYAFKASGDSSLAVMGSTEVTGGIYASGEGTSVNIIDDVILNVSKLQTAASSLVVNTTKPVKVASLQASESAKIIVSGTGSVTVDKNDSGASTYEIQNVGTQAITISDDGSGQAASLSPGNELDVIDGADTTKTASLITANKLPNPTETYGEINLSKVESVTSEGNIITVKANLSEMVAFTSSNPSQGTHKWIGLEIKTGVDITTVKYNGESLTLADAAEATETRCASGSFVLYIRGEEVAKTPKEFKLQKGSSDEKTFTIEVEDTSPDTAMSVFAATLPNPTEEKGQTNKNNVVNIVTDGSNITIYAKLGEMVPFLSSNEYQASLGESKWLGLEINTGESTLAGIKYSSGSSTTTFTEGDWNEAGITNHGSFALYIRAEEVAAAPKEFSLEVPGKGKTTYTIRVVDTTPNVFSVVARKLPGPTEETGIFNLTKVESVTSEGNIITVRAKVNQMTSFPSSDTNQGSAKWVGLEIKTGVLNVASVEYNGYPLGEGEVEAAAATGCAPGSFVLYIKADDTATYSGAGRTITIQTPDASSATSIKIKVVDTSLK